MSRMYFMWAVSRITMLDPSWKMCILTAKIFRVLGWLE